MTRAKHYRCPPAVAYRGYTLKELTLVRGAFKLPVECLATDPERLRRAPLEFHAKHGIQGMVGGGSPRAARCTRWWSTGSGADARLGKEIELGEAAVLRLPLLHGRQAASRA